MIVFPEEIVYINGMWQALLDYWTFVNFKGNVLKATTVTKESYEEGAKVRGWIENREGDFELFLLASSLASETDPDILYNKLLDELDAIDQGKRPKLDHYIRIPR